MERRILMKQFFQDVKNSFLLSAAVSIILGIVLIVYPVKTSLLICYIAGALLLFGGVVAQAAASRFSSATICSLPWY